MRATDSSSAESCTTGLALGALREAALVSSRTRYQTWASPVELVISRCEACAPFGAASRHNPSIRSPLRLSLLLITALTLYPRRGFPRAPSPSRGTFRPPLWASGEGPGGSRGCPRTARARTRWPGVARDKALNFLSRPEPLEGRPRRRPKKTLTNAKP